MTFMIVVVKTNKLLSFFEKSLLTFVYQHHKIMTFMIIVVKINKLLSSSKLLLNLELDRRKYQSVIETQVMNWPEHHKMRWVMKGLALSNSLKEEILEFEGIEARRMLCPYPVRNFDWTVCDSKLGPNCRRRIKLIYWQYINLNMNCRREKTLS